MSMLEDVLKIQLDVDPKSGIRQVKEFDKAFKNSLGHMRQNLKKMDTQQRLFFRESGEAWDEYQDGIIDAKNVTAGLDKSIKQATEGLIDLQEQIKAAAGDDKEVEKLTKEFANLNEELGEYEEHKKAVAKVSKVAAREGLKKHREKLTEHGAKAGAAFSKAFRPDPVEFFKGGAKILTTAFDKTFREGGALLGRGGAGLGKKGADWSARGKERGGIGGGAMRAVGGIAQGAGAGLGKVLGPLLETVGKLGPLLSIASGFMGGIVALLIDADAKAKEFQKELLQSASTTEFLAGAGYNADKAYSDLADTVKDIRDASFNFTENMKWGTTAKDHQAFWNTLNQEGVSIHVMKNEFDEAKKAGTEAGSAADYYSKSVTTAVGFTRNFGVSLTEIVSFEAEMMRELSMSSGMASKEFANMATAANDSGMSANKYFAILRGVSSDLNLYNMRMEDAVGLLNKLGKVMNPRDAQKFMSTLTQGFKGMGRTEKLKMVLMAGPKKTKEILDDNLKDRAKSVKDELTKRGIVDAEGADALVTGLVKGEDWAKKKYAEGTKGKDDTGALTTAIRELRLDTKASKKGIYGMSAAIGNLDPSGQQKMIVAAAQGVLGPGIKSLEDVVGTVGGEALLENMGFNQEQVRNMIALKDAMDGARDEMRTVRDPVTKQLKYTEDQLKDDKLVLRYAGISEDAAKDAAKSQQDFAKEQGKLTFNINDRIQVFTDWAMNQLYNIMLDILDALSPLSKETHQRVQVEKATSASSELRDLLSASGGDIEEFRKRALAGKTGQAITSTLTETAGKKRSVQGRIDELSAGPRTTETDAEMEKLNKELGALNSVYGTATQKINTQFASEAPGDRATKAKGIADRAGLGGDATRRAKFMQNAEGDMDLSSAAEAAGFNPDEVGKLMAEALGDLNPAQVATALAGYSKQTGGTAPALGAGAPTTPPVPASAPPAAGTPPATQQKMINTAVQSVAGSGSGVATPAMLESMGLSSLPQSTPGAANAGAKVAEDGLDTAEEQLGTLDNILKALRVKGVRMDKTFLEGPYGKQVEDSVLKAAQEALFEYWLYSDEDKGKIRDLITSGNFAGVGAFAGGSAAGHKGNELLADATKPQPGNAEGGTVTSLHTTHMGGHGKPVSVAQVRPARGEGLASVGKGERILTKKEAKAYNPGATTVPEWLQEQPTQSILPSGPAYNPTAANSSMAPPAWATPQSFPTAPTQVAASAKPGVGGGAANLKVDVDVKGLIGPEFDDHLKGVINDAIFEWFKKYPLGR